MGIGMSIINPDADLVRERDAGKAVLEKLDAAEALARWWDEIPTSLGMTHCAVGEVQRSLATIGRDLVGRDETIGNDEVGYAGIWVVPVEECRRAAAGIRRLIVDGILHQKFERFAAFLLRAADRGDGITSDQNARLDRPDAQTSGEQLVTEVTGMLWSRGWNTTDPIG